MAKGDAIKFEVPKGAFDDMAEYITRTLKRDVDKRKQLLTLLRKAGKSYLDTVKMTSISEKHHDPIKRGRFTYDRGTLSRSMKFWNGKSRTNITVSIGPKVRSSTEAVGYYGLMVMPVRSQASHISNTLDWKGDALRKSATKTREETLNALEKYMKSKLKRLRKAGFQV